MPLIPEKHHTNIKDSLIELNCCSCCILKYLGYQSFEEGSDTFLHPESHSTFFNDNTTSDDHSVHKKIKSNPCRSCLNILNKETMEKCFETLPEGFKEYEMQHFLTNLHFPMSLYLRDYSMFLFLKEKFPLAYKDVSFQRLENTKTIFKIVSSDILGNKMNKIFSKLANFQINISIQYEDDNKEIENVYKLDNKASRQNIGDVLAKCTDDLFKTHFPVPPNIQDKSISTTITYSSSVIFLGGRYLKFSREMGQTPFIVKNKRITETSVQDIVFGCISEVLGCEQKNLKLCASGREDADTRMLGDGRPFYIQIDHPKFDKVSYERCRAIEASVLKSDAVVLRKLKVVSVNEAKKVKLGEQEKKKSYRALCITLAPNIPDIVNMINAVLNSPIKIQQTTPIRVLHRRSHIVRERFIYDLKVSLVEGQANLFYLDLLTQAGTYVKEFVHGDFNRTTPNISEVIGYPTDVVALDVTDVDLEWP